MDTLKTAHLRIARPTDRLSEVVHFYRDILGFQEIAHFDDHEGFDGVMLGHRGTGYHLEFTHKHSHEVGEAPTEDNLLVFYIPETDEWQATIDYIESQGISPVKSFNPYWDRSGRTYADPDGYRVVIQNAEWPKW